MTKQFLTKKYADDHYRKRSDYLLGSDLADGSVSKRKMDLNFQMFINELTYNNKQMRSKIHMLTNRIQTMDEIIKKLSQRHWGTDNPKFSYDYKEYQPHDDLTKEVADAYYIQKEAHSITQPLIADDVISEQKLTPEVRDTIDRLKERIDLLETNNS